MATGVILLFHVPFVGFFFNIYSPAPLHSKPHKPHAHICGFVHFECLKLYCCTFFFFYQLFFFPRLCFISKFHVLCVYFMPTFELLVHKLNTIGSCTDPVITRDTWKPPLPQNCGHCSFSIFLKSKKSLFLQVTKFSLKFLYCFLFSSSFPCIGLRLSKIICCFLFKGELKKLKWKLS